MLSKIEFSKMLARLSYNLRVTSSNWYSFSFYTYKNIPGLHHGGYIPGCSDFKSKLPHHLDPKYCSQIYHAYLLYIKVLYTRFQREHKVATKGVDLNIFISIAKHQLLNLCR